MLCDSKIDGSANAAVFINIETKWIQKQLSPLFAESELEDGCVFVVDTDDNIVGILGGNEMAARKYLQSQDRKPFIDEEETFFQDCTLDNQKYFLSIAWAQGLNMQIVRLQSKRVVNREINEFLYVIISVFIIAIIAAAAIAAIISNIIYRPIRLLADKVRPIQDSSDASQDEITALNQAYASLGDIRASMYAAQNKLILHKLLTMPFGDPTTKELSKQLKETSFDPKQPVTLCLIRFDEERAL